MPIIIVNTGSLALHGINGRENMTERRSAGSRVSVAMTAGTVHPKPMSSGRNAYPESPAERRSPSETYAARAI